MRAASGKQSAKRRTQHRRRSATALAALVILVLVGLVGFGPSAVNTQGAQIVRFSIKSPLVHASLPVAAVIPAGATGQQRPLLVFLHGKGGDENSSLSPQLFAALKQLGPLAPDVVFPYGGSDSYWHNRADGAWGSYVMNEVIPQALTRLGADPSRVAIGGVSMGGFGALNLARLDPGRFCAVGGHSAALWFSGGESAPGAFDNAADFARNDVIGAARAGNPYPGLAVWIDVGSEDPFRATDTALAGALRADGVAVNFHIWPGVHGIAYWDRHWGSYLKFYAAALANCHRA
jgi:S-formylglutathione hydrolase FrmB